ncbi:Uncharacterized protein AXF42_Ash019525 [Apostasia shenzhenica]|uniref:CCHC-type domain-containing protein n=1 Tax=Apostasia shenzhenica TaxID=1088818 RepID=A0A2I0A0C9_9ASPA|nr:Uncharacterized protein AXF42_Ash019525 [Apostasia shenzhenica]
MHAAHNKQQGPISDLQHSVASSKHSSTLQPQPHANQPCSQHSEPQSQQNSTLHSQPHANQQASQPSFQKSVANLNPQQENLLQNRHHNFSSSPKQQAQQSRAASSAWARREYVSFGDIDLSNSAHIHEGVVQLDRASISYMQTKLASALVGKLFGRRLSFQFLSGELHKRWGHYDGFKVLDASKDSLICHFQNETNRDAVIRSGPWTVAGQILGLDVWSLDFDLSSVGVSTPIWIRLPALPLYYWGKENLARISSEIGTSLWLDPITANMEKIAFVRICVRVNLTQPLKPGVWINGPKGKFFQRVEYEGITVVCFKCGVVGHRDQSCPLLWPNMQAHTTTHSIPLASDDRMDTTTNNAALSTNVCNPINNSTQDDHSLHGQPNHLEDAAKESVGPWMLVTNRRKKSHSVPGQLPTLVASENINKSTHAPPLKSAKQQQRSSAKQYRAVGQQATEPKTSQHSQLHSIHLQNSVDLQKNTAAQHCRTMGQPAIKEKLLQNMPKSSTELQSSAVFQCSELTQQHVPSVQKKPVQNLLSCKQNGLAALHNNADFQFGSVQSAGSVAATVQQPSERTWIALKPPHLRQRLKTAELFRFSTSILLLYLI